MAEGIASFIKHGSWIRAMNREDSDTILHAASCSNYHSVLFLIHQLRKVSVTSLLSEELRVSLIKHVSEYPAHLTVQLVVPLVSTNRETRLLVDA